MPDYLPMTGTARSRARDFYDIHATIETLGLDVSTPENCALCQNIFSAKDVSVSLIAKIPGTKEFHRIGWESVSDSIVGDAHDFDFYFNYVARVVVRKLKTLWVE